MDIPQAFLLGDAILKLFINITSDMVVYPKQIESHLRSELPFMATEKILMEAVEKGESRQHIHEVVKEHSVAAGKMVKDQGQENDLFERLAQDNRIPFDLGELNEMTRDLAQFTGCAEQQTTEFLNEIVYPILKENKTHMGMIDSSLDV
jgi:adenylosuccinate lyase